MTMNQAAALGVRWKGRVEFSPCAHRDLTLNGRYLRWKGIDLKRSLERYTCNGCGTSVVRTLNTPVHTDPLGLHAPPCAVLVPGPRLEDASLRGPHA